MKGLLCHTTLNEAKRTKRLSKSKDSNSIYLQLTVRRIMLKLKEDAEKLHKLDEE